MISSSGQSIIFHRIYFCSQITLIKVAVHVVEECLNLLYRLDRIRDEIAQLGDVAVSMKTDVVVRQEVIYQYLLLQTYNRSIWANFGTAFIVNVALYRDLTIIGRINDINFSVL